MNKVNLPSSLKVFNGREDLDFDDVQEMKPTEQFDLGKNIGKPMRVNIPRFKNVNVLTVRINLILFIISLKPFRKASLFFDTPTVEIATTLPFSTYLKQTSYVFSSAQL